MKTILNILLSFGNVIGSIFSMIWKNKTGRVILIVLIACGVIAAGGKIWLNNHDANLIASNDAKWVKQIADSMKTVRIDTSYQDFQPGQSHQSGIGKPDKTNWKILYIDIKERWEKEKADKDSLLEYYTEPIKEGFEDSTSIDTVTYIPFPARQLLLDKYPKKIKIPTLTITQQSVVMQPIEPYNRFQWFNPRIHADLYPFTGYGIVGGFSASIASYGISPKQSDMILYLPMIGFATDTKKTIIGTLGMRWNIAHYIGLFQDTHLTLVLTTEKKVMIGIGTTL